MIRLGGPFTFLSIMPDEGNKGVFDLTLASENPMREPAPNLEVHYRLMDWQLDQIRDEITKALDLGKEFL